MEDYEKLGVFYLGRSYDLEARKPKEGLLLYDSKHLVTHGVCVGMTGSGKTGLCIAAIEEAAIDGIPAIIIDPKGDLANLLLTFPLLRPEDFAPWINEDDARKKGLSSQDYAAQQADMWKKGLASWQQDGERISRLRQAADFAIYTPGSTAGIPVSILKSFAAPPPEIIEDNELIRDRISSTVTSLLGLLGKEVDPLRSREHILISNILDLSWRQGNDLDIAALIHQIQTPPMTRIGVMELDAFYPAKDRFELALSLNNLLAAPGFNVWMEGEPLDIANLLYTGEGKPRVAIFSIAHLNDSERMFFVSLLLNQVLAWMRTQSGTTSLRAMLYMDEIYGYFPPVANPPSKGPLLTLLKQARAFGVGILLATQNPVDLDYKGLANTGTWFIGRLQTERDKMRVLEGLEGAAAATGKNFDRQSMEQTLAGLGKRIFLMNNVNYDAPVIFETRWVMSYLRGPLTRNQIKVLMEPRKAAVFPGQTAATTVASYASVPTPVASQSASAGAGKASKSSGRPILPPEVTQYFVPLRGSASTGAVLLYTPMVLGTAQVHFGNVKTGVDITKDAALMTQITEDVVPVNWNTAIEVNFDVSDLEKTPREQAVYLDLPSVAGKARSYDAWGKELANWIYGNYKLEILKSPSLKQFSNVGESERDFRVRIQLNAREQRDAAAEKLRQKYEPKLASLQERVRKAQAIVDREAEQAKQQKTQMAISVGATLLGAFLGGGRSPISSGTIGRATTSARGASRIMKESQDVGRAKDTVVAYQQQLQILEADFKAELDLLSTKIDPLTEELEHLSIRPAKKDVLIRLVTLVWLPNWQTSDGRIVPAWS